MNEANVIDEMRKEKDLTFKQVSQESGVSVTTVRAVMGHTSYPSGNKRSTVEKIVAAIKALPANDKSLPSRHTDDDLLNAIVRVLRGESASLVSKTSGIDASYLSRLMTGERRPDLLEKARGIANE